MHDDQFGIPIEYLEVILEYQGVYAVPKAPDYIRGVLNLQGRIITIVEIAMLLGYQMTALDENARIVVLATEELQIGFVVSAVSDFINISEDILKPPQQQSNLSVEENFIESIFELDKHVVSVLHIETIISYLATLTLTK